MFKHEALFWEAAGEDSKVHCFLCPHHCIIAPGRLGFCGVRRNIDGKLYSLIYGCVSSACVDPIEKKPLFHFHPSSLVYSIGALGCNMRCGDCQNWQIAHARLEQTSQRTVALSPEELVAYTQKTNCQGVAWTYNEPTIWMEYAIDGARLAKSKGLYTVFVTNGYVEKEALDAIGPYLDAYRVDIKGRIEGSRFYKEVAKIKDPRPVLDATIRAKKRWKMHVEMVTNIVPGYNDSPEELKDIAKTILENLGKETPWHVTRFYPYLELSHLSPTPIEKLEEAWGIGKDAGLDFVYIGNVPEHPGENTYCNKCEALLIERIGYYTTVHGIENGKCTFCGNPIPIVGV
ncbi:MAG TPA: AmmeMemoRadiSam system radical SAM enzyme [Candidatus Hypogeohydataceae bacterium YC38]|nr:AmmeMemoRadiSam system radical SAM enzyme [Candidatus Brocadiales bacterium]